MARTYISAGLLGMLLYPGRYEGARLKSALPIGTHRANPTYTLERRRTLAFGVEYTLRADPTRVGAEVLGEIIPNKKLPWEVGELAEGDTGDSDLQLTSRP